MFELTHWKVAWSKVRKANLWASCALGLIFLTILSGCHHNLRLPAIDPNGSSIFLPHPNATQLTVPRLHSTPQQPGFLPSPAFQAPAAPPPCLDGGCEPAGVCNLFHRRHESLCKIHDHFRSPGKVGEIQLTPLRVVAPVGGEVVFLAGLCGEDGYLVKQQPIEWMLSPDSVGQLIEVSDDSPGRLAGIIHPHRPKVEKLDVDFAKGRTSSKPQTIDRGTPECTDDIQLRDGETWVSVSSPTAGVSRLTVLAPESKLWDRRRQTAVVYWLDAQWQFPQPQIGAAGSTLQYSTRVTKSEGFVPATDWIVQYTIVDPNVATFANPASASAVQPGPNSNQMRVRVDANGMATIGIIPTPTPSGTTPDLTFRDQMGVPYESKVASGRGTTPIIIEVISPEMPTDHLPEIVVGRGETLATFSSADLTLQAFGPQTSTTGEQLTYTASLGNAGDINADNARLVLNLPAGMRLISAVPQPGSQTDRGAVWDQGVLAAARQLDVSVVVQAVEAGVFDVVFQAEATGLTAQSAVRTEVSEASLDVRFAPAGGISQAEVGETVQYEIDIRNSGRQTLSNIKVTVESDPGIVELSQGINRVEQVINLLQPGETRSMGIPFQVRQEGNHNVRLRVTTEDGQRVLAERTSSILGQTPRPKQPGIGIDVQFPWVESGSAPVVRVGQTHMALITLRNSGETRLTSINVEIAADPMLIEFTGVDINNRSTTRGDGSGRIVWTPADMLPGQGGDVIRRLWVNLRARTPSSSAAISVQASSAEGVRANGSAQAAIQAADIVAPPVNPPVSPPSTGTPPVLPGNPTSPELSGQLAITLNDFNDPTLVGRQIRYGIRVVNNSNRPNRRVHIELIQPEGARLVGISREGETVTPTFGPQRRVLLPVIEFMRPGEDLYYIFVLVPDVPQEMRIDARVLSDVFPNGVQTSETTTVLAN